MSQNTDLSHLPAILLAFSSTRNPPLGEKLLAKEPKKVAQHKDHFPSGKKNLLFRNNNRSNNPSASRKSTSLVDLLLFCVSKTNNPLSWGIDEGENRVEIHPIFVNSSSSSDPLQLVRSAVLYHRAGVFRFPRRGPGNLRKA